ncbi:MULTISPECIES: helix-turn-helix domain-containing protein [Nocardia]|jgi:transcriptional regulator with XRE-family HTH domain|uniref:HTH cro/C1-type domain-containing protein n=1 Tax=Nocardia aurantia TaxID=2585199 RepID=A0A7K0DKS3_9NOCA|nr:MULTISPECIES: helix-turn-helix transcriptional regulator [Nocardia]MCX4098234.1 helix-turn-helix transcriptional regulator [Nocardia sp. alder85J]MQY25832.1 hypothetical protein [Nocardia aurantia]
MAKLDVHAKIDQVVADELRAARARRRLSRAQLSASSGLAVSTIQRFENGERSPDLRQLHDLCAALRISPVDIVSVISKIDEK